MARLRERYVGATRRLRSLLRRSGLLARLEKSRFRMVVHIRSLFSIYDLDDMIAIGKPWWTYRAIKRVESFLVTVGPGAAVFEYGAGASTVWLSERVEYVRSVEHDREFAALLAPRLGTSKVDLHVVDPTPAVAPRATSQRSGFAGFDFTDYVDVIHDVGGLFDLIVIDGRARVSCLRAAVDHLAPGGIIVFDNAGRRRYRPEIRHSGLSVERIYGFAPGLPYPSCTAILRAVDVVRPTTRG